MDTTAKKKGTALVVLAMLATALAGGLVACNTAQTEEGGVSAWLESQEDISIDTNSLLLYIDEKDGSLPTLTMRGDEDVLVLQLPQGVTRTVRVDEEQSYDSTFFSTFYELEPDENFRVTLPITRRSDGSYGETAVYTFVWGKRDASSFTFRVVMPLDTGNTWESLEFADVIDSYNNTPDFPHDLGASVVQYEGRPCYQFENAQVGVAARTFPDPAEPENWIAEITYGSRSSTFQLGHLFPLASWKYGHVAGEAEFYLRDLTGDGVPEFLFLWGYHQSGMGLDECKIIELTQMQELTVETPPGAMAEAIQIRPVDVCKRQNDPNHNLGYVVYEVTGPDGTKHLCQTIAQRKPVEEYSSELDFRSNVSLHLDGNQLLLSACFVPNDSSMSPGISRLGQLTCQLTYDPKDSIFRIQPPFTMELFDPVDAS